MTDDGARIPPMSRAEWKVIQPILDHALDLPPEDRQAFIAQACNGNDAMRDEVERLVEECERPDEFLNRPASDRFASLLDDDASLPAELPATLADRFRLEREIGRGGMGVVYVARDLKHEREVAVKVMRTSVRSNAGPERFLSEIRTTANLHHPHIVPLYDSGETATCVFFVMPYIDGESLAVRLSRDGPLAVADALRITRDVASALEYAHAQGVIHRDVKPQNILLSGGRTLLADFGIARANSAARSAHAETGAAIGTPAYMSPEQTTGGRSLDARSDIYSLGCVLYEMLSGTAPTAATTRLATAAHGVDPVQPLSERRRDVNPALVQCVARAMALAPHDRFATATDLLHALDASERDASATTPPARLRPLVFVTRGRRIVALAAAMVAAVIAGFYVTTRLTREAPQSPTAVIPDRSVPVDTSLYVLFPFDSASGVTTTLSAGERLRDALHEWEQVAVLDNADAGIQASLSRHGPSHLLAVDARAIARERHAGRFILSDISMRDGAAIVNTGVYDTSGRTLNYATARLPRDARQLDSVFAELARSLLFPDVRADLRSSAYRGTRSRPALQAFSNGREAIDRWDLARADSEFTLAERYDARYAQAAMWLAQVHLWQRTSAAIWRPEVTRAASRRAQLSPHDQVVVDALLAHTRGDAQVDCALWKELTNRDATDFSAWYSLVRCQMSDEVVVRDAKSPSGWAYRSSYQQALTSFQKAFDILPTVRTQFRESWYRDLRALLRLSAQHRVGYSLGANAIRFRAYPSWSGDTLAFVPYPWIDFSQGRSWTVSTTYRDAIAKQRTVALALATTWRHAFRSSPEAMLALAVTLDGLGYSTAIDSVRAARQLAVTPEDSIRTGAAEVWMRVKHSLPADVRGLNAARVLADSLLTLDRARRGQEAAILSGLAALTGHAFQAASLARRSGAHDTHAPQSLTDAAQALSVFAAVGGPMDSLVALEQQVSAAIGESVADSNRTMIRERWLERAATVAFPSYQFPSMKDVADSSDFLLAAQAAWRRHEPDSVRRVLEALPLARRPLLVEVLKFDALYPEAWLLESLGDRTAAIARLDPTLGAQDRRSLEILPDAVDAGTLVRAMLFRAELARRSHDVATATLWSGAVAALWADADAFLKRDAGITTRSPRDGWLKWMRNLVSAIRGSADVNPVRAPS